MTLIPYEAFRTELEALRIRKRRIELLGEIYGAGATAKIDQRIAELEAEEP
jgi:hypothetical protein